MDVLPPDRGMLHGVRNPGGVSCLRYPPGSFCFRGVCCVFLFGFANSQNPISATHCPCQLQIARRAGLPLPERGHTGRHKAKGGGYYSPLRFRSWWAHMCKVCPRAALGSGDFPCKWHFDIKMRCFAIAAKGQRASPRSARWVLSKRLSDSNCLYAVLNRVS